MKPETVRGIAWGIAGLGVAYLVFKAANYLRTMPGNIGDALSAAANDATATLAALPATVGNAVRNAAGNMEISIGLPSIFGSDAPASGAGQRFVNVVNFSIWPASVKAAVDTIKKRRGERISNNSNDYLGWRVYQDGTFTSPAGEYFIDQVMRTVWEGRSLEGMAPMQFSGIGRIDDGGFLPDSQAQFWDWKPVYQQPSGWPSVHDIPY